MNEHNEPKDVVSESKRKLAELMSKSSTVSEDGDNTLKPSEAGEPVKRIELDEEPKQTIEESDEVIPPFDVSDMTASSGYERRADTPVDIDSVSLASMYDGRSRSTTESSTTNMFGTLDIEGMGAYYIFAKQARTRVDWIMTKTDVFKVAAPQESIVAVLRVYTTGKMEGTGATHILTRLLDSINVMVGKCSNSNNISAGFYVAGEYVGTGADEGMIRFRSTFSGSRYIELEMSYEGFILSINESNAKSPVNVPRKLVPVIDERSTAAVIAGLGVRSFALLRRKMGSDLDWYFQRDYRLVTSNAEFQAMMLDFLRAIQKASLANRAVLAGLDTETTGLNMLQLSQENAFRDHIVAIPFGWEEKKAYVICTDMYYFDNVDETEIYPLFSKLFCRNPDYTYQDIELDYCGEHFRFNRKNIMLVGANAGFDIRAFKCHDCDVFFDEDIQILHYNLATDWVQGKNGLKDMTHRYLGVATLELEDLFGKQHKDKYRYLTDKDLVLVYGGADAEFTRALWPVFRRITPDNLYSMYKKYDITALYRTAIATWKGMPVDDERVREQGSLVLKDLETLKEFIYRYAYVANKKSLEDKAADICSLLGVDSVLDAIDVGDKEQMYRYPFVPKNHKHLLFDILGYPVIKFSEKSHEPALDKFVLKKLKAQKRDVPSTFLQMDIMSNVDPTKALIEKDKFNACRYPLAMVFEKYAEVNKEYTSYYKPIMSNDLEGRMFYNFSLQRAATRRILSPGQTMKGSLKKLVVAPPGRMFMCFDASQIEYRHMASLAYKQTKALLQYDHPNDWEERLADTGIARIFSMMHNEESDYHIETASLMTGLPQHQIDHDTRTIYKRIGFGIPYGLGMQKMCENLFTDVTKENMDKTKTLLEDYKKRQFEIIRLLETVRDSAFVPAKIPDKFREMLGIGTTHVGLVHNFVGFYRLFILENLTKQRTGRIRRQAGNCIIQGGAAELFRRMIYNFHQGCVAGGIQDKVDWVMLVHDEIDALVDNDVDVLKLIDIVYTNCTLRYEDHIPYYVGIGFGPTWKDAKSDNAELPVIMVERLLEAYHSGKFALPCDGNQATNLLAMKRHYMCDRVEEELTRIFPHIGPGFQWTDERVEICDKEFSNYTVRAYLGAFCTSADKKAYKDIPLSVQLIRWQSAREEYGFGVDFLTERFSELGVQTIKLSEDSDSIDLDLTDAMLDLTVSLLDDDEDAEQVAVDSNTFFGEDNLFDCDSSTEDFIDSDEGGNGSMRYVNSGTLDDDDDDLEVNADATNPFDLLVSKTYKRTNVLKGSEDNTFVVMLNGTEYSDKVLPLGKAIQKEFGLGIGTLILIGADIRKVRNVDVTSERLDNLDKLICNRK